MNEGSSSFLDESLDDQRRRLELELIRTRNQAAAARLEARAAEIELMIRDLIHRSDSKQRPVFSSPFDSAHSDSVQTDQISIPDQTSGQSTHSSADFSPADESPSGFDLDVDLPSSEILPRGEIPVTDPIAANSLPVTSPGDRYHKPDRPPAKGDPKSNQRATDTDIDTESRSSRADKKHSRSKSLELKPPRRDDAKRSRSARQKTKAGKSSGAKFDTDSLSLHPTLRHPTADKLAERPGIGLKKGDKQAAEKKPKSAVWLVSVVAHVLVLILLAGITLQSARPKDQITFSAVAPETNEEVMETFSIEVSEPESEVAEPAPTDTEHELSPVGELAMQEYIPESQPAPPNPMTDTLSSTTMLSQAMSLASQSEATTEFCGVEGGGNHFVYLVDSSGSMGNGFESARAELLRSIDLLKPDQRFYVVFFDAQSDYMRLSDPETDEPRSVLATDQNKQALKLWATGISMDRGDAPYDAIRFALKLRPDVVFLLSDGEFPQGIEDLLREENKIENLFGDDNPISIVHTISYHSKEGEGRMRRIADQNRGQYRHVPKP